jgi:cysteine synthase A
MPMNIANNVTDLIGNTPLVRLNRLTAGIDGTLCAKLEFYNPAHSVKDRIAVAMIDAAQAAGKIKPETVMLEPTSGNTGIGLAMVCAARGIKCCFVMPETMSRERKPAAQGLRRRTGPHARAGRHGWRHPPAEEMAAADSRYFIPQQFENPANPAIHRKHDGRGNLARYRWPGRHLRLRRRHRRHDHRRRRGAQGQEARRAGDRRRTRCLAGAVGRRQGAASDPGHRRRLRAGKVLNTAIYDEVQRVKADDAFAIARRMATEEGLLVGISSGAAVWAALEVARGRRTPAS